MRSLAILLVLSASPTVAETVPPAAQPDAFVSVGGVSQTFGLALSLGVQLEGGMRLGESPCFVRAAIEGGGFAALGGGEGDYAAGRLGVEAHARFLFVGIDGAVQSWGSEGMTTDRYTTGAVIPRLGVELGGVHVRARVAAELPVIFDQGDSIGGLGLTAAVAYAF